MHKISFSCPPVVSHETKKEMISVLKAGQYSPGMKVKEFESQFSALHGAKYGIFVNSGTDALRLSLLALKEKYGWKDGSRVIVPSLTFVATVNVILQANLTPLFVDVDMNDFCLNIWNLKRRIDTGRTENIVAIMPVHLFGQMADMHQINKLAKERNWKVLEDSCESVLNPIQGNVACFSTYMAHHITTGVGGLALTNDNDLNLLIRSYANHGRNVNYIPGYKTPSLTRNLLKSRFRFDRIGYSCRGTEFQAVLGLSSLKRINDTIYKRRQNASFLTNSLWEPLWSDFSFPVAERRHSWMMYPVVIKENSQIDKYRFCLHLEKNGIETRDMMPITNQPCYKSFFEGEILSVSEWINKNGFYVPCHEGMTRNDLLRIKNSFLSYRT